jgi:tetratricopeptide (TPR) repeat protein
LLAALLVASGLVCVPAWAQGTVDQWPALIKQYEQQIARTPGDGNARFTLAMLYARDGRLLDGYKQLQESEKASGGPAHREAGSRQVIAEAQGRLRANPNDLLARYRLAFARYFLGDIKGTAEEFERIVAADSRNDWGYGYLGQAYTMLGQTDRAVATWERGLSINPNNAVLHYVLGLAYTKKNDKKKAAAHFAAAYRDRTLYDYVTGGKMP